MSLAVAWIIEVEIVIIMMSKITDANIVDPFNESDTEVSMSLT